jgi:nitroreductase
MLELLYKRRSIRKYKKQKIEKDKIEKIIEAVLLSPSGRNLKPWEFVIVDDQEKIKKLSDTKEHGSQLLASAPLAIAVLGDEKIDTWIEDCSIASTFIQLTAETLGLGSCWIQIRNRKDKEGIFSEDIVKHILNIPNELRVEALIAIGYLDEEKKAYEKSDLDYSKISYNSYNKK